MSEHIDKTINEILTINRTETINKTETITKTEADDNSSMKSVETRLHLMEIYLSEWQHRDTLFWKQVFNYFISSLIVMLLPFLDLWGLSLQDVLPRWLFPSVGLIMAIIFFVVVQGYIVRLRCLTIPYQALIDTIPVDYRKKKVKELAGGTWGKIMNWSMANLISCFMFLSLVVIGIFALIKTLPQ